MACLISDSLFEMETSASLIRIMCVWFDRTSLIMYSRLYVLTGSNLYMLPEISEIRQTSLS
jgi:hypothetical protein